MAELKRLGSDPEFVDYYDHEEFEQALLMDAEDMGYESGLEVGREEGHASGLAEGQASERRAIIKSLLTSGMSIDELSQRMNIPKEEIEKVLDVEKNK